MVLVLSVISREQRRRVNVNPVYAATHTSAADLNVLQTLIALQHGLVCDRVVVTLVRVLVA